MPCEHLDVLGPPDAAEGHGAGLADCEVGVDGEEVAQDRQGPVEAAGPAQVGGHRPGPGVGVDEAVREGFGDADTHGEQRVGGEPGGQASTRRADCLEQSGRGAGVADEAQGVGGTARDLGVVAERPHQRVDGLAGHGSARGLGGPRTPHRRAVPQVGARPVQGAVLVEDVDELLRGQPRILPRMPPMVSSRAARAGPSVAARARRPEPASSSPADTAMRCRR